jgi:pimeloyl-ACP methyl ester carboxylesterase
MTLLSDSSIRLPDGRRLAYTEWGKPDGMPVFYFHGTPHSRLWCPDEAATRSAGVRLIAPDRPGIGSSDLKEARSYGDWPTDVANLADALGIERFAVVGWSSGGPYAGSCAALLSHRLTGVGIVNSRHLGQYNFIERPAALEELNSDERAEFDLAQRDPSAAAELFAAHNPDLISNQRDHPQGLYEFLMTAEGDRWLFEDEARMVPFDAARRECFRQGMDAVRWEMIDAWLPWGFRLADISIAVHVWHGRQDPLVKQTYIDFIASTIRNCKVVVWPDVGHLGIAKYWTEILQTLT